MDSPVRLQLKRNDYNRHKLFRKINKRRKAKRELEQRVAEEELKRRLKVPRYEDGKESYPDVKKLVMGDNIMPIYEQYLEDGMTPDEALSSAKRHYDLYVKSNSYNEYESFYAGLLPEVVVKPDYNKKYLVDLVTHYPSKLWPIGHSELVTPGGNRISAGFDDNAYNLVLNNCSDATISALSQAFGTNQGWHLINTPGSAKEFAEKRLGGISYVEPDDNPYYNNATNTYIPATISQLLTLAKFAKKLRRTGQYADGKPSYNIQLNDDSMHNFHFDEEGNIVLDNGTVGTLTLPEVSIRPNLDVINAINRRINRLASHTERTNYYNDGMKNPISGDVFYPHAGGLEPVYPEFDILSLGPLWKFGANVGYNYTKNAANNLWNSSYGQYLRYPIGKLKLGNNVNSMPESIVPRTEQSLILGSDADIAGFRKFMSPYKQITAENAASITPEQWTAAQDAAIARGDMAEAQRLRDLHFATNAPNTVIKNVDGTPAHVYHGTPNKGWNSYNKRKFGTSTDNGMYGEGLYATSNRSYADVYARGNNADGKYIGEIKDLYVNGERPFYVFNKKDLSPREVVNREDAAYQFGRTLKVQGDIPTSIWDEMINSDIVIETKGTKRPNFAEIVVPRGEQFKSADAITYDDNGVRIPLGKRDNFNINDIRYGLLPFLGLGVAGTLLSDPQYGYKNGKASGIHIKPENRGKFTALKKRTGHSTSWFKKNGTPAQKKMATFALNAKKWNHKKS